MALLKRILFGCLLTTLLFFFTNISSASIIDRIVAIVNDDIILESELNEAILLYKKSEGFVDKSIFLDSAFLEEIRTKVLFFLIDEKLIDQEIFRFDISVNSEEITAAIERIKDLNNCYDLDKQLLRDGISMKTFRQDIRKQILKNKLIDRYVYSRIAITDDKIKAYYDKNINLYDGILKYHLTTVFVDLYDDTTNEDRNILFTNMLDFIDQIKSGIDFYEIKDNFSSDKKFIIEYLGAFSKMELSDQIKEKIDGLTIGEATQILNTKNRLQFFYIQDITKTKPETLEMVRDKIYNILLKKESNDLFTSWLDSLRANAVIIQMDPYFNCSTP